VDKIVKWIETKTGGDPTKIVDGYALSGVNQGGGNDWSFEAPIRGGRHRRQDISLN
jgi:hypothetical protein